MSQARNMLLATLGFALFLALAPASALARSVPVIESDYVWEGELVAQLNTEGLEGGGIYGAVYQFQLVRNTDEYAMEISCPPRAQLKGTDGCGPGPEVEGALPIGYLPPKSGSQWVTLDPASAGIKLTPGTTYHFRVIAAPKIVTEDTLDWEPPPVYGPDQTITTPAAEAPAIEGESASHVTSTDATLEATINPEDAERGALYQFQLVGNPSEYPPEFSCPAAHQGFCPLEGEEGLPLGKTSPGAEGQPVSLDLARAGVTLKPGTTYHYRVITARFQQEEEGPGWKGPIVYGPDQTFMTPPAGTAPVVDSVSISHLTSTDATLEARIDTEGQSTSYEFLLSYDPCPECEDFETVRIYLPSGLLLPSFQDQSVSLDLASVGVTLHHAGEYEYSLRAINASGKTEARTQTFRAPPPPPVAEPLGSAITPGPVSDEPKVPPAGVGDQQPTSTARVTGTATGHHGERRRHRYRVKHAKRHGHHGRKTLGRRSTKLSRRTRPGA
jgi:hypothetical protein